MATIWGTYDVKRITKYNAEDGKTVIDPDDDAARVNLGVGYRIPTQEDWKELLDDCIWEPVTITLPEIMDPSQTKTIARWKVTGPSGNSIILPMTGGVVCDGIYDYTDKNTYYTTANLYPAEKLSDDWKYQKAVALTWPFFAESDGKVKYPWLGSTPRQFAIVIRPVFDLYSNK